MAGDPLRSIRLAIDGGGRPSRPQIVGITSPHAGDGKSTVALSVALVTAQGGGRTLLIDGDLRHPTLSRMLAPAAEGGLVAALDSAMPLADQIREHESGLHILPYVGGSAAGHPADLLASPAMQALIERARASYDYVVVDLPAVLAHVDVMAAATLIDVFVLVADWERSSIDDIARSLDGANVVAERLVGAVVNKSRPAVA